MNFKKLVIACTVPTALMFVLDLVDIVISVALSKVSLCIMPFLLSLGLFLLNRLIQLYFAYTATKKYNLGIIGALLVSTLSGLLSSITSQLLLALMVLVALLPKETLNPLELGTSPWIGWAIASFILLVINLVAGVVLGLIGGFIGQKT